MKTYVFTVREDICAANQKEDYTAAALLSKMTEYGTVEDYEEVKARSDAGYEVIIANLTSENAKLKERAATEKELPMLNYVRKLIVEETEEVHKEVEVLHTKMNATKVSARAAIQRARAAQADAEKALESVVLD